MLKAKETFVLKILNDNTAQTAAFNIHIKMTFKQYKLQFT